MAKIEDKVEELILDKIIKLGYELYDVEYVKEGKDYFLRIYIDNKNGITLEDCEKVSNEITDALDTQDYIKEQYFLEVSSPGVERVLTKDKHLKDNINNNIQIKLFNNFEGNKTIKGIMKKFDENQIEIMIEKDKDIIIDRKNIAQIKTIYNW